MPSECITPIYLEPVEAMAELSHTPPHFAVGQDKLENTPGHRPVEGITPDVRGIDQGPRVDSLSHTFEPDCPGEMSRSELATCTGG